MPRKKTQAQVLDEFKKTHGEFYDYSQFEYINSYTKGIVICPVHGEFTITSEHHGKGVGCKKCYVESRKISKEEFMRRAKEYFDDRYDYSEFDELPSAGGRVPITCLEHSIKFFQEPRSHIRGHTGCPGCKKEKQLGGRENKGAFKSKDELNREFITKARKVHGSRYDYNEFQYQGSNIKGRIICPRHSAFEQEPINHISGSGCPTCGRERKKQGTFKKRCKEKGVDYYRALKRRQAGLGEDKIFDPEYIRNTRETNPVAINGVQYPNIEEAMRALVPPASAKTISRWLSEGMSPEEAFERVPNPGYANGVIYVVTHIASGKQYVGLTIQTIRRRWEGHVLYALKNDKIPFHVAIRKYGRDAFTIKVIDTGRSKEDLEAKERFWIEKLDTLIPHGYNKATGG